MSIRLFLYRGGGSMVLEPTLRSFFFVLKKSVKTQVSDPVWHGFESEQEKSNSKLK